MTEEQAERFLTLIGVIALEVFPMINSGYSELDEDRRELRRMIIEQAFKEEE